MNAPPLIIRPAVPADIPAMHRVRLSVRENRLGGASGITEASYAPLVAAGSTWVAELGPRIVGFAAIDTDSRNVWALFVAPNAEATGIGGALHSAMMDWAARQGIASLWLTTSPGTRADHFYRRLGWTPAGTAEGDEIRFERAV